MTRAITHIAVHCTASMNRQEIGASVIAKWHRDRGWKSIGYHFVIRTDGRVEAGRGEEQPGAHVQGHNAKSIGICLVGGVAQGGKPSCNFTRAQFASLQRLIATLKGKYPGVTVQGHRDFPKVAKACPSFSVAEFLTWPAVGQMQDIEFVKYHTALAQTANV